MTFVFVSVFIHFFLCAWQPLVSCPVVSLYWFVLVDTPITCSLFTNSYSIVVDMFVYTHTLLNFDLVFLLFSSPLSLQYVIMGKKLAKLFGKKDMRILMLGLDAAGKTSRFYPSWHLCVCVCEKVWRRREKRRGKTGLLV